MKRSPEAVLADIPGWERAHARVLSGGLSNHAWLVETGDTKAVLKIDEAPRAAPYNSRSAEARIQSIAAEQGLANRVLYATETVYMTAYLEGDVWTREALHDSARLVRLALALRKLHSLPLTGRRFDAVGAARDYAARIDIPDTDTVRDRLQTIAAMPPPPELRCCHNDLVAENIIATPEIHFLDWEYACDNDPLFDLATVVAHHDLSADHRDCLLDAYYDGDGARWRQRLSEFERLYRALLWLWEHAS